MAGAVVISVSVVMFAALVLNCTSGRPQDAGTSSLNENNFDNLEFDTYPQSMNNQIIKTEDKPKNCFHFFVSRNMSSLLADATKMLRSIRDRREREWILTFIYRIKSLAEHLRSHPESKNYDCLPTDDESKKKILNTDVRGQQQPELYFVDDIPKRTNEIQQEDDKTSNDNQEFNKPPEKQSAVTLPSKEENPGVIANQYLSPSSESQSDIFSESYKEDNTLDSVEDGKTMSLTKNQETNVHTQNQEISQTNKEKDMQPNLKQRADSSIVLSSSPDCDSTTECQNTVLSQEQLPRNYFSDSRDIYSTNQVEDALQQDLEAELYEQELLKERIRKALLEELGPEIKKLRTVGGTEEDLKRLWNSGGIEEEKSVGDTESDFDYEETGAAAGDLNMNEKIQPDRTVAPSLDEVHLSKESANNFRDSSYQPYDDSDVLVQQLFEVKYNDPPPKTTKSLIDQNIEYLITSTHTPFLTESCVHFKPALHLTEYLANVPHQQNASGIS